MRLAITLTLTLPLLAQQPFAPKVWPSEEPSGCPFERSKTITGIRFTGRHARYTGADTWYPSWAADGRMYSNWTDGTAEGVKSSSIGPKATTGYATLIGDDPLSLKIVNPGTVAASPLPYGGRYPSANLFHRGIWYYGTYCLNDSDGDAGRGLNWDILGPFVGFRISRDKGETWLEGPHTPSDPLFPEPAQPNGKVKFGAPHFVDLGREMRFARDGYAYLVGHGARDPDPDPRPANASWITGDQVWLARVKLSPETVNDRRAWQFFAGHDKLARPVWTSDFTRIQPLLDWNNHLGNVSITFNAPLGRFLMAVTDGVDTISRFHTMLFESASITGPWRLIVYMKNFGEQAYFVHFPSKFISSDGRTAWLCYAANFTNGSPNWKTTYKADPPGSGYGMTLQEVELLKGR